METYIINVAPGVETALARALEHSKHFLPGCVLGQIETRKGCVMMDLHGSRQDPNRVKAKILLIAAENGLDRYVRGK